MKPDEKTGQDGAGGSADDAADAGVGAWMDRVLTCQVCGHSRATDGTWLRSAEVRRALDKSVQTSCKVPRCSQCGARGWGNVAIEDALPDPRGARLRISDYGPQPTRITPGQDEAWRKKPLPKPLGKSYERPPRGSDWWSRPQK